MFSFSHSLVLSTGVIKLHLYQCLVTKLHLYLCCSVSAGEESVPGAGAEWCKSGCSVGLGQTRLCW